MLKILAILIGAAVSLFVLFSLLIWGIDWYARWTFQRRIHRYMRSQYPSKPRSPDVHVRGVSPGRSEEV